jgi:hypothetical protein
LTFFVYEFYFRQEFLETMVSSFIGLSVVALLAGYASGGMIVKSVEKWFGEK